MCVRASVKMDDVGLWLMGRRGAAAQGLGRGLVKALPVVFRLPSIVGAVAMLWVGSYAKTDPTFIGIPFFYWYQMVWVLISTALTMIESKLWQHDQRSLLDSQGGPAK